MNTRLNKIILCLMNLLVISIKGIHAQSEPNDADLPLYQTYPAYEEVISQLKQCVIEHPNLCTYKNIGNSYEGKDIPSVVITNMHTNNTIKPRYWISGATHGNEPIGTYCVMTFIRHLLSTYGHDRVSKKMINEAQWHLTPILNVDGYCAKRRTLSDGTDPNRSFGWQIGYKNGPDAEYHGIGSKPFPSPEICAYALQFTKYPCVIGLDFHSGQEAVYGPFFADHDQIPDDLQAFHLLGAVFTHAGDGVYANGGNREKKGMPGIQTDYAYTKSGTLSLCLELCTDNFPPHSASIAEKHVSAIRSAFLETQKGMKGKIIDQKSKKPLYARVSIEGCGSEIYTSLESGTFFKYMPKIPSLLSVTVVSNGYKTKTFSLRLERPSDLFIKTIALQKDPRNKISAMSIDFIRCYNFLTLSESKQCLGIRDGKTTAIQSNGNEKAFIIFDMGPNTPVQDGEGTEITVVSPGNTAYTLFATETLGEMSHAAAIKKVGEGWGVSEFDLKNTGLDRAHYLKVEITSGTLEIDAIEAIMYDNENNDVVHATNKNPSFYSQE